VKSCQILNIKVVITHSIFVCFLLKYLNWSVLAATSHKCGIFSEAHVPNDIFVVIEGRIAVPIVLTVELPDSYRLVKPTRNYVHWVAYEFAAFHVLSVRFQNRVARVFERFSLFLPNYYCFVSTTRCKEPTRTMPVDAFHLVDLKKEYTSFSCPSN
jgi:hypothetical protein